MLCFHLGKLRPQRHTGERAWGSRQCYFGSGLGSGVQCLVFGMLGVWDSRCLGCAAFRTLCVQVAQYLGCSSFGIVGIWDAQPSGCLVFGMLVVWDHGVRDA